MTRNTWVSAFICGSHICRVQPSEFDSISVGPPSRPSTETLSRQPSASIMGMVVSSSCGHAGPMAWPADSAQACDIPAYRAIPKMKVGPVSARFKGKVTLSDLDPPNGYKISGEGEGGVAGFAKGGAVVKLADKDGGTLLSYNVEAQIGGKLAQLGQRLINGSAKKLADEFFANFAKAVQG